MIEHLTSFAVLDANIESIRTKKESLKFSEIAAMNALIYQWHKKGCPPFFAMADREFEYIIGLCRQHATKVRRSLKEKCLIDFHVSQGSITKYFFTSSMPAGIEAPPRRSRQPIEDKEALLAAMRRQIPAYEKVNLEKHFNEFVIWYAQNAPEKDLTPSAFRKWMRDQVKNGYQLHPITETSPMPVGVGMGTKNQW